MPHYAKIVDGLVEQVIVADASFFDAPHDAALGQWLKTSYNMYGGVYHDPQTGEPHSDQSVIYGDEARERKNYAGVGYAYDQTRNAFIPPKPYDSWGLNEQTCLWEPPVPYPSDGADYVWDEPTTSWIPAT